MYLRAPGNADTQHASSKAKIEGATEALGTAEAGLAAAIASDDAESIAAAEQALALAKQDLEEAKAAGVALAGSGDKACMEVTQPHPPMLCRIHHHSCQVRFVLKRNTIDGLALTIPQVYVLLECKSEQNGARPVKIALHVNAVQLRVEGLTALSMCKSHFDSQTAWAYDQITSLIKQLQSKGIERTHTGMEIDYDNCPMEKQIADDLIAAIQALENNHVERAKVTATNHDSGYCDIHQTRSHICHHKHSLETVTFIVGQLEMQSQVHGQVMALNCWH